MFGKIHRNAINGEGIACYSKAVIGLHNTCDCCGCTHDLADNIVYQVNIDYDVISKRDIWFGVII